MDDVITQVSRGPGSDQPPSSTTEPVTPPPPSEKKRSSRLSLQSKWKRLCSCCYRHRSPSPQVDRSSLEDLQETTPSPPPPGQYLLEPTTGSSICLVIDLDETLVHSSFKPIPHADFIVPVEIDGQVHQVYVAKRPYVDEFLEKMGELYECVLFTASLAKYADPVADLLDHWGVFKSRLFRESCVFHRGNYVKDLARLGRDLGRVVIVDNSPASYIFHPDNAVPVCSWFDDAGDTELLYLIPFFQRLASVQNVYSVLRNSNHPFNRELKAAASAAALNSSAQSSSGGEAPDCNNHSSQEANES